MSRSRSERRHHRDRIKQRVKTFRDLAWNRNDESFNERVVRRIDTRKPCSCYVCCNDRRNPFLKCEKLTMQERREFQKDVWD
jgi:hypothetical protein